MWTYKNKHKMNACFVLFGHSPFIEEEKNVFCRFSRFVKNTQANIFNNLQQPEIENYTKPTKSENKLLFMLVYIHNPNNVEVISP